MYHPRIKKWSQSGDKSRGSPCVMLSDVTILAVRLSSTNEKQVGTPVPRRRSVPTRCHRNFRRPSSQERAVAERASIAFTSAIVSLPGSWRTPPRRCQANIEGPRSRHDRHAGRRRTSGQVQLRATKQAMLKVLTLRSPIVSWAPPFCCIERQ